MNTNTKNTNTAKAKHFREIELGCAGAMAERIYNATYTNGKLKTCYAKYNFIARRLKAFAERWSNAERINALDNADYGVWFWCVNFDLHLSITDGVSAGSDFYRYFNDSDNYQFKALVKKAIV